MRISPATISDLEDVMPLVRAAVAHMDARGILQWDEVYPDARVFADDLAAGTLYTARLDGRLAGVIVLNEYQDPEYADVAWAFDDGPVLVVHRLCVHPDAQRRGVAARLMDHAEALAAARGYRAIRLDAFQANPGAVALYDRRGYRRAGAIDLRMGPFWVFEKRVTPA
jgi:GNAT superfamily N-acetyltransferase